MQSSIQKLRERINWIDLVRQSVDQPNALNRRAGSTYKKEEKEKLHLSEECGVACQSIFVWFLL